jgi:hypothetical protein
MRKTGRYELLRHCRCFAVLIAALVLTPAATAEIASDIKTEVIAPGQVLRGHFTQERQLAGFAKPLHSEGSFVLAPGRGLIWRGEKPFANTTIISSDGILQLVNGQPAMRLPASRLPGLSQLYEVLGAAVSGNIKPLQQTFAVTQSRDENGWRVVMIPLHPENAAMAQLKTLTLTGNRFVDSATIEKRGGDRDRIAFTGQQIVKGELTPEERAQLKATAK